MPPADKKRTKQGQKLEPPMALDAERAVLGSILKDPLAMDKVQSIIPRAVVFHAPKHRTIYRAMQRLYVKNEPTDIVTILPELGTLEDQREVGGRVYLVELVENVASTANVASYAKIVSDRYQSRRLIASCQEMMNSAYSQEIPVGELLDLWQQEAFSLGASQDRKADTVAVADVAMGFIDDALKRKPDQHDRWLETRIADLNKRILGLFRGEMTIIAGPPSMMKTSCAIDICEWNRQWGHKSLFISLDQTMESFIYRLVSSRTGIPKTELLSGRMSETQRELVARTGAEIAGMNEMFITERTDRTVMDIRAEARKVKRERGLDILVVDYVQQIPPHAKFDNRNLEITEISRILKATAKELDIALILLSQINRTYASMTVNPKTDYWAFPNRAMLRDSGSLEQDANLILFPWIPDIIMRNKFGEKSAAYTDWAKTIRKGFSIENRRRAYMIVDKFKDGETSIVDCVRDPEKMIMFSQAKERDYVPPYSD